MKKKIILTTLLGGLIILLFTTEAHANYQITPNVSRVTQQLTSLARGVRQMESEGQVMGLSETINTSTLEANTPSNNIDVHLLKNTEYGAIVILSASQQYGKQGTGVDSYIHRQTSTGLATTTGNQYGIYDIGQSSEWVAGGGISVSGTTSYLNKYYDRYKSAISKPGDATTEASRWKASSYNRFCTGGDAFERGYNGAFSYGYNSYAQNSFHGRAAVWCGQGF